MNSTPWSTSTVKISSNLSGAIILERHEAVHKALKGGEALRGSQAEHPKDDVIIVPFPGVGLPIRLGAERGHVGGQGRIGRMAHGFMIARFSE
jgi:hypothetical protein